MYRKPIAAGLSALLAMSIIAGCSSSSKETAPAGGSAKKELRYNMGSEPRYLDPELATDSVSFAAVTNLFEGLTRSTAKGLEPGMAEKWEEKDNGLTYVFHLRDGLKWSNGDPITAEDFVYSWTRALDPRVGSEYAYQLYYIKGGEALNNLKAKTKGADGKEVDNPDFQKQFDEAVKNLGVKAVDAKTLEVKLEAPTPYFLALTSFPTLNPVEKKLATTNGDWASKAETFVSNGPFKLTSWEHKKQLVLEKNPNYWDAANVKLDKMTFYMVEDQAAFLNMYESDQVDVTEAPAGSEAPRLLKEGKLKVSDMYGTYFYLFNVKQKPFDNPKVRKALAEAIDRKAIVTNVTRAGQKPGMAFVPPGSMDADGKTDFRQVGGDLIKEDIADAKKLLAEAGYPDGKGFPEVTFLYNTSESHKAIGEAIIEMWKKNLGITTIKMENTEWKVVLDKRHKGDYQMARGSWIGDYADPMTFMDMFVTGGGNNDIFWSNTKYDQLIKDAKSTADQKVRMAKMHEAEKLFVDEMPILPIYFYNNQFLQKDNVSGVYRSALGMLDFKYAEVK